MRIAVTGQMSLRQLDDLLDDAEGLPKGLGGTPPIPEVRRLVTRGHDVSVVTLDWDIRERFVARGDHLTIHVLPCRKGRAALDGFRMERRLISETLLRCRPDVIHAHWAYEHALGALATGLPTVVTVHDAPLVAALLYNLPSRRMGPLIAQVPAAMYWMACTAVATRVVHKANNIIAVSPYVEQHLRRVLRYRGNITVIPNMVPGPSGTVGRAERPSGGSFDDGIRFVSVLSSWSKLKNGTAAIAAFARARVQLPRASLRLIGSGFGPGGPAETWAAARGLSAGITFVGQLPHAQVLAELATADILVHPALEEACCMVIAEAQLAGVAVIGGRRSGGVPWSLDYGRSGLLVDVRSTADMARAMVELGLDSCARQKLAVAGSDLAEERFDPDRLISDVEAMLSAAADAGPPPLGRRMHFRAFE